MISDAAIEKLYAPIWEKNKRDEDKRLNKELCVLIEQTQYKQTAIHFVELYLKIESHDHLEVVDLMVHGTDRLRSLECPDRRGIKELEREIKSCEKAITTNEKQIRKVRLDGASSYLKQLSRSGNITRIY